MRCSCLSHRRRCRRRAPRRLGSGFAAAQLFLDRAVAVRPDVGADEDALTAVEDLPALDGIPLALELAAARLASLSATELAERVQDRFAVLTSGNRTAEAPADVA